LGTAFIMPDKGKVECFIGYLKGSFWVPFVASMRQAELASSFSKPGGPRRNRSGRDHRR
jgi:hypothetical protein